MDDDHDVGHRRARRVGGLPAPVSTEPGIIQA